MNPLEKQGNQDGKKKKKGFYNFKAIKQLKEDAKQTQKDKEEAAEEDTGKSKKSKKKAADQAGEEDSTSNAAASNKGAAGKGKKAAAGADAPSDDSKEEFQDVKGKGRRQNADATQENGKPKKGGAGFNANGDQKPRERKYPPKEVIAPPSGPYEAASLDEMLGAISTHYGSPNSK